LRFGRILSATATLSGEACATWLQVTYAAGKQGYINISKEAIKKLSDADFPSFMGWQKLSDGNTPFSSDGLCDIAALKTLVKDAADNEQPTVVMETTEVQKAGALSSYVKGHDGVRQALRGFICNAPSEWDSTHNQTRYAKLLDEGGFYHGNERGYNKFLNYLNEIQFWDTTGLPAGQKLWFFHPLAFIRHFRKCSWLSQQEYVRMFPSTALRSVGVGQWVSEKISPSHETIAGYGSELNKAMCKFGITTPLRQAAFLGNAMQETQWFSLLTEGGGMPPPRYAPWIGRGFLQLTWPDNYIKYWHFSGRKVDQALADRLREAANTADTMRNNSALVAAETGVTADIKSLRESIGRNPVDAAGSAGAYWAWSGAAKYADMQPVLRRETKSVGTTPRPYYSCESFGKVAATVNVGHPSSSISSIYGLQARFQGYTNALMVLTDWIAVPGPNGSYPYSISLEN
jgi:predicted chitinase